MLVELKKDLKTKSARDIYNKYLLGQNVWFFEHYLKSENPSLMYDDFKRYISKNLNVHFNNIAITGSAKTGISFSPKKKLKLFNEKSDLDIILVSDKYYEMFWKAYLEMFYKQIPFAEYGDVKTSIFKGFISLKDPTEKHKDIKEWTKTVNPLMKDLQMFFGIERGINYRIYDSWDSVEKYHFFGIKQLQSYVNNNSDKHEALSLIMNSLINRKYGDNK